MKGWLGCCKHQQAQKQITINVAFAVNDWKIYIHTCMRRFNVNRFGLAFFWWDDEIIVNFSFPSMSFWCNVVGSEKYTATGEIFFSLTCYITLITESYFLSSFFKLLHNLFTWYMIIIYNFCSKINEYVWEKLSNSFPSPSVHYLILIHNSFKILIFLKRWSKQPKFIEDYYF